MLDRRMLLAQGAAFGLVSAAAGVTASISGASLPDLGAVDALRRMADGSLSAETYATALLARARDLSDLGAIISYNDAAVDAARTVDRDRKAGRPLGPLAGLPIMVKDNIDVAGLRTTAATPALHMFRVGSTAPILQRLLDAGAIMLAKTNMHELALGITTANSATFAGIARNPYDRERIPGGSSGGNGVAIATGMAPIGIGADTGGSVRIPAALCGIVGLRPSVGNGGVERRYPIAGILPLSATRDTAGPHGRSVADVALIDAVVTGAAPPPAMPLAGVRLGVPPVLWEGVAADVRHVLDAVLDAIRRAGAVLVEADLPGLHDRVAACATPIVLHEAGPGIAAYLAGHGREAPTLADIAAQVANPDVRGAMAAITADAMGGAYPAALAERQSLRRLYDACFAANRIAAMLFPTTLLAAATIDAARTSATVSIDGGPPRDMFQTFIRNTDPGSTVGLPGLSLPAGLTSSGLPVGLALDGPVGSDRVLLGLGQSIERLFGPIPRPAIAG